MRLSDIPHRAWFAALALGVFGLVSLSLGMQSLLRLNPCPLCIFQRILYLGIGLLALGGVLFPVVRRLWAGMIALTSLSGMAVAGYQSWMQLFSQSATECGYGEPNAIERLVDSLGMLWPQMFLATGFCTSREWEFLGRSMADWSFLIYFSLAFFAVWLMVRPKTFAGNRQGGNGRGA